MKKRQLTTPPVLSTATDARLAPCLTPGSRVKLLAVATTVALLSLPGTRDAQAQSIGALEVRSRLGERFFGAVPVRVDSGVLDPACIRVLANPNAPDGAEPLPNTRVRIGSVDSVIIETTGAVTSPIVGLRLEVGCGNTVSRDFVVLADIPSDAAATPTASSDAAAPPASAPKIAVTPPPAAKRPARPAPPRQARPAEVPPFPALPPLDATPPAPVAAVPATKPRAAAGPAATGGPAAASVQSQNAQRLAELQARSDDQAAAILAIEDRLALLQKQAELLKLQLEQALAGAATVPAAASATAPAAAPSTAPAASVAGESAAPQAAAPAAPPKAAAAPAPQVVQQSPRKEAGVLDLLLDWRVGGGIAALLLGAVAFKLRRRPMLATDQRKSRTAAETQSRPMTPLDIHYDPSVFDKTGEYPVASAFATTQSTAEWPSALQPPGQQKSAAAYPQPTQPPATDNFPVPAPSMTASQIMRAATPATMSREYHITQQFQPDAERVVALSAPEEIVQQARTHYMDDGDVFRAIDLLEMAVSVRNDSPRPWQALFAIYRRENMPERYQRLVLTYRTTFGEDENWPAIQSLGRAMDPTNPLYAGADPARPLPEDLLERWLGVPLDFTAHLLANEMHDQLMSTSPGRKRRRTQSQ